MKRFLLLLMLCFMLLPDVSGQRQGQDLIDSLIAALPKTSIDTLRIKLFCKISNEYAKSDPVKGVVYAEQGLALATKNKDEKSIAKTLFTKAEALFFSGKIEAAKSNFILCREKCEEIGNEKLLMKVLYRIAGMYAVEGKFSVALDYFFQLLKRAEAAKSTENIALARVNIANVYDNMNDNAKAIENYATALQLYKDMGNKVEQANTMLNMAISQDKQKQYGTSLKNSLAALQIANGAQDPYLLAFANSCVGLTYNHTQQYELAASYLEQSIAFYQKNPHPYYLGTCYAALAFSYLQRYHSNAHLSSGTVSGNQNTLFHIKENLDKALAIDTEIGNTYGLQDVYRSLAEYYKITGNFDEALKAKDSLIAYTDSIYTTTNKETIKNLEDKREIMLRDKQLKITALQLANQKRQRYMYLGGLGLLAVIGVLLFHQSRVRKQANEKLSLSNRQLDEANRVKARFFGILSHDLRAPIASLTGYLHLQREAPELMDEPSKAAHQLTIENAANNLLSVMEDLLLWSKGQMNNFKPEIKSIPILQLFEEIKKLVPHDTDIQVVFDDPGLLQIDTDENFLKTIMRNLTANALKALKEQPGGKVEWKAWEENGKKYLSVSDNGPGLTKEQIEGLFSESAVTSAKTGLGLHIIRDFARMLGQQIEVKSDIGKGTSFVLTAAA